MKDEHSHSAHDHEHQEHSHEHKHEHQEHSHEHGHKHAHEETEEEMPAWKKKALESGATDPMAAPFGGDWNKESNISAKDSKMEE